MLTIEHERHIKLIRRRVYLKIFSNEVIIFILFVALMLLTVVVILLIKVYTSDQHRIVLPKELGITSESSKRIANCLIGSKTLSEINEIIINNVQGQQLSLSRSDMKTLGNKKFIEVTSGGLSIASHTMQGAMPILAQAQTISEINRLAPNGLFAATVPISELMKYSNGTLGSPVMGNGHVVKYAGFNLLDNSGATVTLSPAAVVGAGMQAMAAISGQHYMHQISKQLTSITKPIAKSRSRVWGAKI